MRTMKRVAAVALSVVVLMTSGVSAKAAVTDVQPAKSSSEAVLKWAKKVGEPFDEKTYANNTVSKIKLVGNYLYVADDAKHRIMKIDKKDGTILKEQKYYNESYIQGYVSSIGYGDNTKAALMTRGIAELTRLGEALGGKPETFSGLTGVGDLIVTCTSVHSRNRKAGYLMGKGMTADEAMKEVKMVVEGVYSAKAALGLAKKCNVSVPIVEAVNRVLFENADPKEEVSNLLLREKKQEHTNLEWN